MHKPGGRKFQKRPNMGLCIVITFGILIENAARANALRYTLE